MEKKTMIKKAVISGFALTALAAALSQAALAEEYWLCAEETTVTIDSVQVPMWGLKLDNASGVANLPNDLSDGCDPNTAATVPGPELSVPAGDSQLIIHLYNGLPGYLGGSAPSSIVISGQALPEGGTPAFFTDGEGRQRVRSFTTETGQGAVGTYTWNNLRAGTFLYHSGTHPQVQVQMGLYGAVTKDDGVEGDIYGTTYTQDTTLIIGEVDVSQHNAIANGGYGTTMTSTIDYNSDYVLVNGIEAGAGALVPSPGLQPDQSTLLRILNAGLKTHSLEMLNTDLTTVAEDGYGYGVPRDDYGIMMQALKSKDVLIADGLATGQYPIIDTSKGPGAVLAKLDVATATPVPKIYLSTWGNFALPGVADGTGDNANSIHDDADIYVLMSDGSYDRVVEANYTGAGPNDLPVYADVDGLAYVSSTDYYLSFVRPAGTAVPGLGDVNDTDIVHYNNGTWELWFDGAANGLEPDAQKDIDALDIIGDVAYFSTRGTSNGAGSAAAIPGVAPRTGLPGPDYNNADIYSWDKNTGTFARVFDGIVDGGLPNIANIDALSVSAVDVDGKPTDFCVSFFTNAANSYTTVVNGVAVSNDEVICYSNGAWDTANKFVSDAALNVVTANDNSSDIDALDLP